MNRKKNSRKLSDTNDKIAAVAARCDYFTFRVNLANKAKKMGQMVPKIIYCPGPSQFITAGQYATAIRVIREAYNKNPQSTFPQSFENWTTRTAANIIRYEILPAIHERINMRHVLVNLK